MSTPNNNSLHVMWKFVDTFLSFSATILEGVEFLVALWKKHLWQDPLRRRAASLFLCGAALAAFLIWFNYPYMYSADAHTATRLHLPVDAYVDVTRIVDAVDAAPMNSSQMNDLVRFSSNGNVMIRMIAITGLCYASKPEYRSRALQIAHDHVFTDSDKVVRLSALRVLYELDSPDLIKIALQAKASDKDETVQELADKIIAERKGVVDAHSRGAK